MGWKELAELLFPLQVQAPKNSSCLGVVGVYMVTSKLRSMVGNIQVLQLACAEQGSV